MLIFIVSSIFAATCSSLLMTYISLVTPLGPWVEPLLILSALMVLRPRCDQQELIASIAAAGGVAGIAAVCSSFCFPTLYFLDPLLFATWIADPFLCIGTLALFIVCMGLLAFVLIEAWESTLLGRTDLPFPVSTLMHKMIVAHHDLSQRARFTGGIITTGVLSALSSVLSYVRPSVALLKVLPSEFLRGDSILLLISLGFVMGSQVVAPLIIGYLSKIMIIPGIQHYFFSTVGPSFVWSWCSGMMLYGVLKSGRELFASIKKNLRNIIPHYSLFGRKHEGFMTPFTFFSLCALIATTFFLCWWDFSVLAVLFLAVTGIFCAYQLLIIAGKMGIAPLGRFAMFGVLGHLFLFGFNAVHCTFVAAGIELFGGIAVDLMFGRKLVHLVRVSRERIMIAQLLGLIVGSIVIASVFWFFCSHGTLGSAPFIAQRAQTRALLIHMRDFHAAGVLMGACFGFVLQQLGVNAVFVMSGLLMPLELIIPLVIGGFVSAVTSNREEHYPFWAGMCALSSCLLLIKTVLGSFFKGLA